VHERDRAMLECDGQGCMEVRVSPMVEKDNECC
jgi:hypothetical protein